MSVGLPEIKYSLGADKEKRHVFSALSLTFIIFIYFFVIGSSLPIGIYTFQNRVTYENIFTVHFIDNNRENGIILVCMIIWLFLSINSLRGKIVLITIFSTFIVLLLLKLSFVAQLGALSTLPVLILIIVIDKFKSRSLLNIDLTLSWRYVQLTAILLASAGITALLISILSGLRTIYLENYAYAIYQQLLSNLTPILITGLAFCVPWKIIQNEILGKLKIKKKVSLTDVVQEKLNRKQIRIYLLACILFAICVAYIPHISTVNPNNERLGVDSTLYSGWVKMLRDQNNSTIQLVFKDISSGDRPLTLIILYVMSETIKIDTFQMVEFSPLILAPLLAVITFFLTREITSNDKISIIASFLTSISFQSLIGMYAGFYANWLALILGYLVFTLAVKYLKNPSTFTMVTLALVMTGVLLAHNYTWSIVVCIAFVYLLVSYVLGYYPRKRIIFLYLILSSSIAVDILKSSLANSTTGLEANISAGLRHGFGVSQFNDRLKTLAETVQTYYGGAYANIAILGLVVYWLIRCKARELTNIFMLIFLSSSLIPLFLGDWVLQSRVLYNIPFQIPAAIALRMIWRENNKITVIAILLVTGYLSIHVIANLGYIPPSSP